MSCQDTHKRLRTQTLLLGRPPCPCWNAVGKPQLSWPARHPGAPFCILLQRAAKELRSLQRRAYDATGCTSLSAMHGPCSIGFQEIRVCRTGLSIGERELQRITFRRGCVRRRFYRGIRFRIRGLSFFQACCLHASLGAGRIRMPRLRIRSCVLR